LDINELTSVIEPKMKKTPLNLGVPEIHLLTWISRVNRGRQFSAGDTGAQHRHESHQDLPVIRKPCYFLTAYLDVHSPWVMETAKCCVAY